MTNHIVDIKGDYILTKEKMIFICGKDGYGDVENPLFYSSEH